MKAIILSAGRGTRLHPLTENCPKSLTILDGLTLIDRQIATLKAAGINEIIIATGYRSEMFASRGGRQVFNSNWSSTNMVETLFCAESEFGEAMIVSYGDIVYEPRVLDALLADTGDISVVVDRNWRGYWETRFPDPLSDAESLQIDSNGCIADIGSAVTDLSSIEAQYIGLMCFRGAGIDSLRAARANFSHTFRPWMKKRSVKNAYMTDILMEIILMGQKVQAVSINGGWLEIDTVEDYQIAMDMIDDGSIKKFFDPSATPNNLSD